MAKRAGRPARYEPVDTPEAAAAVLLQTIPDEARRLRIGMRATLARGLWRFRDQGERVLAKLRDEEGAVLRIVNARLEELEQTLPGDRPATPDMIHLLRALNERGDALSATWGRFYMAGLEDVPKTEVGAIAWALQDQEVTGSHLAVLVVALGWEPPHYPNPLAGRKPTARERERATVRFKTRREAFDQALRRARKQERGLTHVLLRAGGVGGPFRLPGCDPSELDLRGRGSPSSKS